MRPEVVSRTYTESAPHRRRVALLRFGLAPDPANANGSQDDARHAQAHLHHGQQEQTPQDLAAGAHSAPGISPAPARGGGRKGRESPLLGGPRAARLYCFILGWRGGIIRACRGPKRVERGRENLRCSQSTQIQLGSRWHRVEFCLWKQRRSAGSSPPAEARVCRLALSKALKHCKYTKSHTHHFVRTYTHALHQGPWLWALRPRVETYQT